MNPLLAHLVTTGLGPIYDGIGHLIVSFEDLIPVIAMALLAGLRGPWTGRYTLFVLPIAWMVGGIIGLNLSIQPRFPLECVSFLVIGILVAADLRLPERLVVGLAAIMGLAHGFLNGVAMAAAMPISVGVLELVGVSSAMFVLVAMVAAFVVWLRWDWTRIAVRVAGSWVAAMGLLWLGWTLRPAA